ncbi:MAG TPA: ABC transporter permease [Anaerolineales bacterium]|nr:ABC transporter permease [Anaerolineales bacterium]
MISRLLAMIRKEFIQAFRDRRTVTIILIMPIMQLFLLGYAATTDVKNIAIAVWDQNQSVQSRALLDAFRSADYFQIAYTVNSQAEVQALIESGRARAVLIIPPDYEQRLMENNAQVSMILDGSDASVGSTALSVAQLIGQSYGAKIVQEQAALQGRSTGAGAPLQVRTRVWYNPDLLSAYFMIPGVIGQILFMITTILTATSIVRERERGTIEQLIVTPIRPWELMVGKITPYIILAFVEAAEVILIGHFWFKVPIEGSLMLVALSSGLLLLSSLGIGLFASTLAHTQQEANIIVQMTLLPSFFLSGFFFPIEAMPYALQLISYLSPLRYYLVAIRALMLKGADLAAIQNQLIALAVFGLLIMGAAARRFHKTLD